MLLWFQSGPDEEQERPSIHPEVTNRNSQRPNAASSVFTQFLIRHQRPQSLSRPDSRAIEIYQRITKCHNTNRESLKRRVVKSRRTEESSSASPANYRAVNVRNVHSKLKTRYEFIGFKEQGRKSAASCPFLNRPS